MDFKLVIDWKNDHSSDAAAGLFFYFYFLMNLKSLDLFETNYSKALELEDELRVVGNNMKSLEISEQEVSRNGAFTFSHIYWI